MFIWRDGVMTDLHALVALGYEGHLVFANDIHDDAGVITGMAISAEGELVAFVATPTWSEVIACPRPS